MSTDINKIIFKTDIKINILPTDTGRPIFTTDTNDLYIGVGAGEPLKRITVNQDSKESDDFISVGQPVYINNSGHTQLAKAIFPYHKIVGLALNNVSPTFACNYQTSGIVTLSDWTNIIGTPNLSPNTYYFLDYNNVGKLITDPTGADYSVKVGYSLDNNSLDISNKLTIKL